MKIATGYSIQLNEDDAVYEAINQIKNKIGEPDFIWVLSTSAYNNQVVLQRLTDSLKAAKIFGGTSCQGVMTDSGFHGNQGRALALWGIKDDTASFGVAAVALGSNPKQAGQDVVRKALEKAERPGEAPSLILMISMPGYEEAVIDGITSVVGSHVPIFGGSSADNSINGEWQQFAGKKIFADAVTVAVIYTSHIVGYAFNSGYMPTESIGTVTSAKGRIVQTIDNKPAADVYNEWTGGLIKDFLGKNANILSVTTLFPLGRVVGMFADIPYYTLSHPNEIFSDGSLSFFSTIQKNDQLILMSGTKNSLETRVKRVIHMAKENLSDTKSIKGALIIYCAGCMLTIQDNINKVNENICSELPKEPFMVMFSFGEQGCLLGNENRHGNLMISSVIFGEPHE